jgi:hypothetical protein
MKKPTQDEIDCRVSDVRYYDRTELPCGHRDWIFIGGAALSEARRDAKRARAWLRKRGLGDDGRPLRSEALDEACMPNEEPKIGYMQGSGAT